MKDTNPLTTPNNVLTDCLNGTTITYNGKEFVLQNDMGNAIVETASLKRGYIPIGLKEYNGIIYVVSYNPLDDRVEFGSFPSPERDFSGEDFDPEGYNYEGCELQTSDFYIPNSKHPEVQNSASGTIIPDVDSLSIIPEETVYLDNPITTNNFIPYQSERVDNFPSSIGVEDYWKLNTMNGQPKFNISKSSISDDFSSYEALKLNTGDRFVIYYIDNLQDGITDYIKDIFLPYVSDKETKRLFKVETFAVTEYGRKLLDVDPFKYDKEDTLNFLNGSTTENIEYNIYNFDNLGTIEIRISLEKPDYFNVKFKQYTSNQTSVKFTTNQFSQSFIQFKGYKYILKYLSSPSEQQRGYMYYNKEHLYVSTGSAYTMNKKLNSTTLLTNLSFGTYSYEILPFTQYGYEYDFIKRGTFDVLENLTNDESSIIVNEFWWNYIPGTEDTYQLHFDVDMQLTPPDQTITQQYLELYDVWSNCSHIIELTASPTPDTNVNFTNTFKLSGPQRTKTHSKSSSGQIYGVPYNTLKTTTLAKLPTQDNTGQVNYENKVEYIDPVTLTDIQLRKNHFYVLAIYYKYDDTLLNQSYTKGIYRYIYTNDAFQDFYGPGPIPLTIDFSNIAHYQTQYITLQPHDDTTLNTYNVQTTVNTPVIDKNTLLFDPLLQTYNDVTKSPNEKYLSAYAIGPESYFSDVVTTDSFVTLKSKVSNQFSISNNYKYNIEANAPGDINPSILNLSATSSNTIIPTGTRIVSSFGTTGSPTQVFGSVDNQTYIMSPTKVDDRVILSYNSNNFDIYTNKIHPFEKSIMVEPGFKFLYPLFYQQSREVQKKIVGNNSASTIILNSDLSLHHYANNPGYSVPGDTQYMILANTLPLNMNLYSDDISSSSIGMLSSSGFWNAVPDKGGIQNSNLLNSSNATLLAKFLDATKRKNGLASGQSLWYGFQQMDSPKQYIPIKGTAFDEGLEISANYNTQNIFLFFGAYNNTNPNTYYKYSAEDSIYFYESAASTLNYTLNHTTTQIFNDDYCYKIVMGAKNKTIILQESGSDESLQNYILSKFTFDDYSNPDFFPKSASTPNQYITYTDNILIRPNQSNTIQTYSDPQLTYDYYQHPTFNQTLYTVNKLGFLKNDFKLSTQGIDLNSLLTKEGITNVGNEVYMSMYITLSPTDYTFYHTYDGTITYPLLKTFKINA